MYREISMSERLDRIGEILAKGVYLYAKKEKMEPKAEKKPKPSKCLFHKRRIHVRKINSRHI